MILGTQRSRATEGAGHAQRRSLYAHVGSRVAALLPLLGLQESAAQIRDVFAFLCRASLTPPGNSTTPRASRLNADGTPFQFALTLGARPPLQFVSEPAAPETSNGERLQAARARVDALMPMFGIDDVADVHRWLDRVAPNDDPYLVAAEAGPIWLGVAFAPASAPRLKIYINAKWGPPRSRWMRIDPLVDYVGAVATWRALRPSLHYALEPLGMALTLCVDAPPEGRVYFHAPGMTFKDHEAQAAACASPAVHSRMPSLRAQLLADETAYATRSAVCSFGLQGGAVPAYKFEVCAHCAFASDTIAKARCRQWLVDGGFNATAYAHFVDVLSPGELNGRDTRLHVFVGIGERHGVACPTFYFNPAAAL